MPGPEGRKGEKVSVTISGIADWMKDPRLMDFRGEMEGRGSDLELVRGTEGRVIVSSTRETREDLKKVLARYGLS